jgi:hypothetical protein
MAELVVVTILDEYQAMDAYLAWERSQSGVAFERTCTRRAILKRKLSCGHWVDGSELYRYHVHKLNCDLELTQRLDCEPCARADARY